ncbi:MAG TPA: potassium-transporting ATPase subunit KdpC [Candidatus Dormibacteraeota bacterium]|nr:potassium-transporting ATPase subunit KdpC [Candidatus Dormibacteraeota bacterium]
MLRSLPSELLKSLRLTIVYALVTGLAYPLLVTGIAQALFPSQANGSLVTRNGQVVGSSLIGQQFISDKYFHGRPSATVDPNTGKPLPYAANNSGGSNLAPSNKALIKRVSGDVASIKASDPGVPSSGVPVDLVTTDFSGVDPDISEAAALTQVERVAQVRGLDPARVRALVEAHVDGRVLWIFGEPHVNVLSLNMALDAGAAG